MNIELDEVVVQDVSDDVLELAVGGAQGGPTTDYIPHYHSTGRGTVPGGITG